MPSRTLATELDPPAIVELVAHPLRWRLLGALTQSDRTVGELTQLVDERQNLISYHLRKLRDGGAVTARRSAWDGRDVYYAIDLAACERELRAVGPALHPGLRAGSVVPDTPPASARRPRVLFLCTGNSARSQIAEALAGPLSGGWIDAMSAGSHPKPLHPNAVRVTRTRGIDISTNRTKPIADVASTRFDVVITLCDKVREVCPELPGAPRAVHWSIADPATAGATVRASYPAFERTAVELETRIRFLFHQLIETARRRTDAQR